MGLTAGGGDLTTFAVGDFNLSKEDGTMLRFDIYSPIERDVTIELTALKDKQPQAYRCIAHTVPGEWTTITRAAADFKDDKLRALKAWSDVKRLSVIDVNGVMLNNILWT